MSSEEIAAVLTDLPAQGPPALVVDRVTRAFEQLGSPEDAQGVSHFIPGAEHTYGLRIAQLRAMGKHVAKHYDYNMCRSIARASWPRGSREHRMFALFLLEASKLSPAECWKLGLEFLPGVLTWEDCDQLCSATLGRALPKDSAYMDQLETWLDDENFWVRRAALVSTVFLRRASYPLDLAYQIDIRTLAMCAALLEDKEPYVRKAVDFAVRETLKRNYKLVRDWLLEQARANPSRNARTTLKLSAKKLNDDDQAAFLAALGEG